MTDMEKCEAILGWAEDNDFFSTEFVDEMYDILESGALLTSGQSRALDNIMDRWGI